MRELVYLSDAKLSSFVDDKRSALAKVGLEEVEIGALEILKLKLGFNKRQPASRHADGLRRAEQIVAGIDSSERPVRWWEDDEVTAGRWVQFEARLRYVSTVRAFVAWLSLDADDGTGEQVPDPLLLLHGSARHTVGNTGMRSYQRTNGPLLGSEPGIFQLLHQDLEPYLRDGAHEPSGPYDRSLGGIYSTLHSLRFTNAGDFAGYARVTDVQDIVLERAESRSINRRLIVATPLYVERV